MEFGTFPLDEAEGGVLAHSLRLSDGAVIRKGHVLSAADLVRLRGAGVAQVTVARLVPYHDIDEDHAAMLVGRMARGPHLSDTSATTGRVNLIAECDGLLCVDRVGIDRINRVGHGITLATLPPFAPVRSGQMVATVKVIPFAVPRWAVRTAIEIALTGMARPGHKEDGVLALAPFTPKRALLIQTRLPGIKDTVLDKTAEVTRDRLAGMGAVLAAERRCDHTVAALAATLSTLRWQSPEVVGKQPPDLVLLVGASAITDVRDVLPAAVVACGGQIEQVGMPVDPGNLLMLARLWQGTPLVGLPGCARSPKLNGADWVLQRLCADLSVGASEILGMGVGGLLQESPVRPQPRTGPQTAPPEPEAAGLESMGLGAGDQGSSVAAVVLAAGLSRRMGDRNKLLAAIDGVPMLRRVVTTALASRVGSVVVVTGHEPEAVAGCLQGLPIRIVHNPDFAEGLSRSLAVGLAAVPQSCPGALICLGDMPRVPAAVLDALIAAFDPEAGRSICVPMVGTKRGNPVLWARCYFAEMQALSGDTGARSLLARHADAVHPVQVGHVGVLLDVDTPRALVALEGVDAAAAEAAGEETDAEALRPDAV